MKILKRLSCFLLAMVLALTFLPAATSAAEIIDSGECGAALTWTLTRGGTLTVSGQGEMENYSFTSRPPWYDYCWTDQVQSIILGQGITSVGDYAFSSTDAVVEITIPDSVILIGKSAFSFCGNLTTVSLSANLISIGQSAFQGCEKLPDIVLPEGLTSIGESAFSSCGSLSKVVFPASLTSIGETSFSGCASLNEVTFPTGLTEIGYEAFASCTSLTEIYIPSKVSSIGGGAFSNCASLDRILVDEKNKYYCCDSYGVLFDKKMTELISAPVKLSGDYTVPEGVKTVSSAFDGCVLLENIYLPKSLTSIFEGTFRSCSNLKGIWVDKANRNFFSDEYGVLFGPPHWGWQNRTALLCAPLTLSGHYTVPEGVEVIECHAFPDCTELTGVTLPDGVKEISYGAFENCTGLTEIMLPGSVTTIDFSAFENCSGLTRAVLPAGLSCIEMSVFRGCSSLTDVVIPEGVVTIEKYAFLDCTSLTSITIPASVTSIGYQTFAACSSLTDVIFLGAPPTFEKFLGGIDTFLYVTATCHYPEAEASWTEGKEVVEEFMGTTIITKRDPRQDYGGTITWKAYSGEPGHTHIYKEEVIAPTCTEGGYTAYKCSCGESYTDSVTDPTGHSFADGKCTVCGVSEAPQDWGNANGDEIVDYMDAMLVLRHAVKLATLSEEAQALCDVDGKGGIDYMDAMLILRKAVKLIEQFPVELQ